MVRFVTEFCFGKMGSLPTPFPLPLSSHYLVLRLLSLPSPPPSSLPPCWEAAGWAFPCMKAGPTASAHAPVAQLTDRRMCIGASPDFKQPACFLSACTSLAVGAWQKQHPNVPVKKTSESSGHYKSYLSGLELVLLDSGTVQNSNVSNLCYSL